MKIGITGIANEGKTVFLTSLLWHLSELEHSSFSYSTKNMIEKFTPQRKNKENENVFPFDMYREKIAKTGQWPAKTTSSSMYSCHIKRKDWDFISFDKISRIRKLQFSREQELTFFDFPGERIADAAIAALSDYGTWSDHILNHFKTHLDYHEAILPYLTLLEKMCFEKNQQKNSVFDTTLSEKKQPEKTLFKKTQIDKAQLIYAYKLVLANLIHRFKPFISPSVFLLDEKGKAAPMLSEEELAKTRLTGLTEETQFIPLPAEVRSGFPEFAKEMASYYATYREQVAWPLFKKIIQSQRLVILIDIPSLLMGGVDRYNDSRQIIHDLFEAIEPQGVFGKLFQKLQSFMGLGLEKIAFVAVKSDLVRPTDIINGKLKNLLQEMTLRAKKILPDVEYGFFVCSAIHSTREGKNKQHLIGKPLRNNPHKQEMEFMVSALPDTWPEQWGVEGVGEVRDFQFLEVAPHIPRNLMIPPRQSGLDQVLKFLVTDKGVS